MKNPLNAPGIGLLLVGVLNLFGSLIILVTGLLRLLGNEALPTNEAERLGFIIGTVVTYGVALVSLALSPLIIYSAVQLIKGRSKFSKPAAILAMLPLSSCCFVIGIPVGIWVLVVLAKPDTKAFLDGSLRESPPAPPQF